MTPAVQLPPAERAQMALRIARQCRGIHARSWGSPCCWCGRYIPGNEERGWIPEIGALHVDCLVLAVDEADAALRLEREARQ